MARTRRGSGGEATELAGEKCKAAVAQARQDAHDALEEANEIEAAWRSWDTDTLVELDVITETLADDVDAELGAE